MSTSSPSVVNDGAGHAAATGRPCPRCGGQMVQYERLAVERWQCACGWVWYYWPDQSKASRAGGG